MFSLILTLLTLLPAQGASAGGFPGSLPGRIPPTAVGGGFTTIPTPSATFFVSADPADSPSDSNLGTSAAVPFATLKKAIQSLAAGDNKHIALERGFTYTLAAGGNAEVKVSGLSADFPIVVKAYGTGDRPIIDVSATGNAAWNWSTTVARHWWWVGLEFTSSTYTGASGEPMGLSLTGENEDLLIEDCVFSNLRFGIYCDGGDGSGSVGSLFRIRRNIFTDIYDVPGNGGSSAVLTGNWNGLFIEGNYFSRCSLINPNVFSKAVYAHQSSTSATLVRDNIFVEQGVAGIQLRCGGTIEDNMFVRVPISIDVGGSDDSGHNFSSYVQSVVRRNVVIESNKFSSAISASGRAIWLRRQVQGLVEGNIVAHKDATANQPIGILLDAKAVSGVPYKISNVTLLNNTIRDFDSPSWPSVQCTGASQDMDIITAIGNVIQRTDPSVNSDNMVVSAGFQFQPNPTKFPNWSGNKYQSEIDSPFYDQSGPMTLSMWTSKIGETGSTMGTTITNPLVFTGDVSVDDFLQVYLVEPSSDYATWQAAWEGRAEGAWLSDRSAEDFCTYAAARCVLL